MPNNSSSKNWDIYYCISTFQLLSFICHRLTKEEAGGAVLLISDLMQQHFELERFRQKLLNLKIFDEIKFIPEKGVMQSIQEEACNIKDRAKAAVIASEFQLDKAADLCWNFIHREVFDILQNAKNIYLAADQYPFGLGLSRGKIPYIKGEEHGGHFSRQQYLRHNIEKLNPFQLKLYDFVNQLSEGNIKGYLVDISLQENQEELKNNKSIIELQLTNWLNKLSREQLEGLFDLFGVSLEELNTNDKVDILLTSPYSQWGFLTIEEHVDIYKRVLDYVGEGKNLVIKPHPTDWPAAYKQWLGDVYVFPGTFPSELLLAENGINFERCITGSSTAVYSFEKKAKEILSFGLGIENKKNNLNKYFATACILQKIKSRSIKFALDESDKIVETMAKWINNNVKYEIFYDSFEIDVLVVDLFEQKDYEYLHENIAQLKKQELIISFKPLSTQIIEREDIITWPIIIENICKKTKIITLEYAYIYTTDAELIRALNTVEVFKELVRSNEVIKVKVPHGEDSLYYDGLAEALQIEIYTLKNEIIRLQKNLSI